MPSLLLNTSRSFEISYCLYLQGTATILLRLINKKANHPLGHAVAQLVQALRYKSKVAGSIPDGVIEIFH